MPCYPTARSAVLAGSGAAEPRSAPPAEKPSRFQCPGFPPAWTEDIAPKGYPHSWPELLHFLYPCAAVLLLKYLIKCLSPSKKVG